jgi:hypothetical protein
MFDIGLCNFTSAYVAIGTGPSNALNAQFPAVLAQSLVSGGDRGAVFVSSSDCDRRAAIGQDVWRAERSELTGQLKK